MVGLGILGVAAKSSVSHSAQHAISIFRKHPFIELRALIAEHPEDVGKNLGELADRWVAEEDIAPEWRDVPLISSDPAALRKAGVSVILSSPEAADGDRLEPILAAAGFAIVSKGQELRARPDVPLIVPDINADHLALIRHQKQAAGYTTGFLVASPLCTAVIAALSIKPLLDKFGLQRGVLTTLQALSGAGRSPGVRALDILDNVLPFIGGEESKMDFEIPKILGHYDGENIKPLAAPISSTCTRVNVRHGHTISTTLSLGKSAEKEEIIEAFARYEGVPQRSALPNAAIPLIDLRSERDRPQPYLDRNRAGGRGIAIGQVRKAQALENGVSFVTLGHNQERGTIGNMALLTELIVSEGLVRD